MSGVEEEEELEEEELEEEELEEEEEEEEDKLGQNRETLTSRDRAPAGYAGKGDLMRTREFIVTVSIG